MGRGPLASALTLLLIPVIASTLCSGPEAPPPGLSYSGFPSSIATREHTSVMAAPPSRTRQPGPVLGDAGVLLFSSCWKLLTWWVSSLL